MADEETSKLHKDRNKILMQHAEQSFTEALDEINVKAADREYPSWGMPSFRYGFSHAIQRGLSDWLRLLRQVTSGVSATA